MPPKIPEALKMDKSNLVKSLQENLQLIYRQSVDADKQLTQLREIDKAKFGTVFADQHFRTKADTFLPYVEELAADLLAIQEAEGEQYKKLAPYLVIKIELVFKTLSAFKAGLKEL